MISPKKILAIKLRSMGDTVLMTAPLVELNIAYPNAEIHVAVLKEWASLITQQPGVTKVWPFERHPNPASRAKAVARLGLELRKQNYDLVVNFHASPSSATLAFATGARVRAIHFHGHADRDRFTTLPIPGKGNLFPVIERDMNVIRALSLNVPPGRLPKLVLDPQEIEYAWGELERLKLAQPLLAIGIGASRPTKSWPIERFAALARGWVEKTGGSVLALASEKETKLAQEFLDLTNDPDRIKTHTRLKTRELAAILKTAQLLVGNDSGPRHIAVAVGTPTVTLFGPEDPFEWHPYPRDRHPILYFEGLPCRRDAPPGMPAWCGLHECIIEEHKCMRRISEEEVLSACLKAAEK